MKVMTHRESFDIAHEIAEREPIEVRKKSDVDAEFFVEQVKKYFPELADFECIGDFYDEWESWFKIRLDQFDRTLCSGAQIELRLVCTKLRPLLYEEEYRRMTDVVLDDVWDYLSRGAEKPDGDEDVRIHCADLAALWEDAYENWGWNEHWFQHMSRAKLGLDDLLGEYEGPDSAEDEEEPVALFHLDGSGPTCDDPTTLFEWIDLYLYGRGGIGITLFSAGVALEVDSNLTPITLSEDNMRARTTSIVELPEGKDPDDISKRLRMEKLYIRYIRECEFLDRITAHGQLVTGYYDFLDIGEEMADQDDSPMNELSDYYGIAIIDDRDRVAFVLAERGTRIRF